jgi:Putative beta-barrel porin-2, OmpL-like. bbp2
VPAQLPGGATLNYYFDGYYGYDFNHPIGRVQYLRAYDVLSNAFSINQTGLVLALDPNVEEGKRYGVRLDLQFGQATETLQGNPANEPRPEIYRNIYQAYGTYVFPVGKGLTVDFGKWSSSIGIEGNYTKDQMNYTRSFFFDYLPFYHMGVRANYKLNDKIAVNYWLVNGTEQTEPTNSYKDELFGLALQPKANLSWTINYFVGQDHPDVAQNLQGCDSVPIQPELCLKPITPAPDGKQHIFDSYATWNVTPKVTLALEGDYVIGRLWANAALGQSSAPSHVVGGAGYARYQWTPKMALAGRAEYLSDRGGLFSGTTQALKEFTGTYEYKVADGLLTRLEYRRDWSNVPFFLTNKVGVLSSNQDTLTVGMVWWYGGKQGIW